MMRIRSHAIIVAISYPPTQPLVFVSNSMTRCDCFRLELGAALRSFMSSLSLRRCKIEQLYVIRIAKLAGEAGRFELLGHGGRSQLC